METAPMTLVTIIAEGILEERIARELHGLGARGHTAVDVRGEGSRGVRATEVEGKNVRIDVLVNAAVAQTILEHLQREYFEHYAVVAYLTDVSVIRGEKYG
jgi:nitrogen regulatory protein P-II 2